MFCINNLATLSLFRVKCDYGRGMNAYMEYWWNGSGKGNMQVQEDRLMLLALVYSESYINCPGIEPVLPR